MLDMYGTPYTRALHVVERYRLLDYEAAREELERDAKESLVIPNPTCAESTPHSRQINELAKKLALHFW